MNKRRFWSTIIFLYFSGFLTGVVFVTPPASSPVLTSPLFQNLSATLYGSLFIPMIVGTILTSFFGGKLAVKIGLKAVYLSGISTMCFSMILFAVSGFFMGDPVQDYLSLLTMMFFLGAGFGATITSLNAMILHFFPNRLATAISALHALLGLGTAAAPLLFNAFHLYSKWWKDPVLLAICLFMTALVMSKLLEEDTKAKKSLPSTHLGYPKKLLLLLGFMFVYGIAETLMGNWGMIYLQKDHHLTVTIASYSLSVFWGMVTVGRILTALLTIKIDPKKIYLFLPLLMILGYFLVPFSSTACFSIITFGLVGLACSGCFPLSFNFGELAYPEVASIASGRLMTAYMLGYGVAAYGVGLTIKVIPLGTLFHLAFLIPCLLFLLALLSTLTKKT
ncbi:MFS transporter [Chlamydiales bacterium]|nr:MFS transporter [Chlamydiales bacterium]